LSERAGSQTPKIFSNSDQRQDGGIGEETTCLLMVGLNHAEAEETIQLIKQIRDSGILIVVVEHTAKAILGLSDRIVVLNIGKKIAEGSPQKIVHDPQGVLEK
jgi:ABC-type uncharacterized transport system ATPase subunit